MRMRTKFVTIFFLVIAAGSLKAQDYVFSLNQFTPVLYNPGSVASDNEGSLSFLNRKTNIGPGINYTNNCFVAKYPLINREAGKRFGGIGVHFLQKDAGTSDLLQSVNIGLSLAYNLAIAKDQFISFGLQSNYNNTRTSLESLTSGNQWVASEFRFDRNAPLGEPITDTRVNYFSVNAGALWYWTDKVSQAQKAFAGVSFFNLNNPNQSFFAGESKIPMGYLVNAGAILYHTKRYHLVPQLLYQYDNYAHITNVMVSNRIFFSNDNPYDVIKSGHIELLGRYDLKKDLGVGVVFHQPGISFGFNYNVPLANSNQNQYFTNAFEFGIKLSRLIWKPEPQKVTISNPSTGRRNFEFGDQHNTNNQGQQQVSDTDIIQKNIENYSKVNAVQFELDKNFRFEFGRTELNGEAKEYLDELYKLLEKNPDYNIEVIGHTDNVGKHVANYKISAGRAKAVEEYLVQKGLSREKIRSKGMGDTHPVAPNDTDENRAKNRRVQFIIYVNR
jgi:type IX secretion system PorP/SprF family membrane protein